MNKLPLVSIVIPVYNREHLILETLQCAQLQTYSNFEIIVVDNQSTDNTWNILLDEEKKDNRLKIYQNQTNLGPVRNWEQCFEKASGEFIKILWSDDLIESTFVEATMKLFKDEIAFVMTGMLIFSEQQTEICKSNYQGLTSISTAEYIEQVIYKQKLDFPVSPGCAIFRKKDLINNLIIDIPNSDNLEFKRYGAGNDLLLFLITAADKKYSSIALIEYPLSKFRSHEQSITVIDSERINLCYAWSKWFFVNNYYGSTAIKSSLKARLYQYYKIEHRSNTTLIDNIDIPINKILLAQGTINCFSKKMLKKIIPQGILKLTKQLIR